MHFDSYYFVPFTFTVVTCLVNGLLIYSALKVTPKKKDLILIIILAIVEYNSFFILASDLIYTSIFGERLIDNRLGCQITGSLIELTYCFEIILNVALAYERLVHIRGSKTQKYYHILLIIYSLLLISILIYAAITGQMTHSPSKLLCILSFTNSFFSIFAFYYVVIGFFIGICIISYCYYKLAIEVSKRARIIYRELQRSSCLPDKTHQPKRFRFASIRIYIILVFYSLSMFGSVLTYLSESFIIYLPNEEEAHKIDLMLNKFSQSFFFLGIAINSSLLLFLHTGIKLELDKLLKRLFSCFKA